MNISDYIIAYIVDICNYLYMHYYIAYKSERVGKPLTREEAITKYFELKADFKDLCILIYDENDKLCGRIPKK